MDNIERDIQKANTFVLTMIGKAQADLVDAIAVVFHESPLTEDMMKQFREYEQVIEAVGHITDPTGYRDLLHRGGFEEAARRRKLLDALVEYYGYPAGDD
jgi:hypothetical protein